MDGDLYVYYRDFLIPVAPNEILDTFLRTRNCGNNELFSISVPPSAVCISSNWFRFAKPGFKNFRLSLVPDYIVFPISSPSLSRLVDAIIRSKHKGRFWLQMVTVKLIGRVYFAVSNLYIYWGTILWRLLQYCASPRLPLWDIVCFYFHVTKFNSFLSISQFSFCNGMGGWTNREGLTISLVAKEARGYQQR